VKETPCPYNSGGYAFNSASSIASKGVAAQPGMTIVHPVMTRPRWLVERYAIKRQLRLSEPIIEDHAARLGIGVHAIGSLLERNAGSTIIHLASMWIG
jgi:hypothetical protein